MLSPGRTILDVIASTQRRQLEGGHTRSSLAGEAEERIKQALLERGIGDEKAIELAQECDPGLIEDQLEYLDFEIARDSGRRLKNPAGFIIAFIEGNKPIPPTFEPRSKREVRLRAQRKRKQGEMKSCPTR